MKYLFCRFYIQMVADIDFDARQCAANCRICRCLSNCIETNESYKTMSSLVSS